MANCNWREGTRFDNSDENSWQMLLLAAIRVCLRRVEPRLANALAGFFQIEQAIIPQLSRGRSQFVKPLRIALDKRKTHTLRAAQEFSNKWRQLNR